MQVLFRKNRLTMKDENDFKLTVNFEKTYSEANNVGFFISEEEMVRTPNDELDRSSMFNSENVKNETLDAENIYYNSISGYHFDVWNIKRVTYNENIFGKHTSMVIIGLIDENEHELFLHLYSYGAENDSYRYKLIGPVSKGVF